MLEMALSMVGFIQRSLKKKVYCFVPDVPIPQET